MEQGWHRRFRIADLEEACRTILFRFTSRGLELDISRVVAIVKDLFSVITRSRKVNLHCKVTVCTWS